MKYQKLLLVLMFLLPAQAQSQTPVQTLDEQLGELKIPSNVAPEGVTQEKLYSVQNRHNQLKNRFEFNLGAAKNFTGDGMLSMNQLNGGVIYHINDRWSVMGSGSYGFNDYSAAAQKLINDGIFADVAVVNWRADLLAAYNLFYGKFRMNMDQVFYFDQYVAIGPGVVNSQFGTAPAAVADVGFALWFGKDWSARFGMKNDFFKEKKLTSNEMAYHLLGHIEVGYAIGGEDSTYE